jgi:AmmeMemoRadiSam system protein B
MAAENAPQTIRPAAVAGLFYPQEPQHLAVTVESLLDRTPSKPGAVPKALIVPHAGYAYSGPVAARAYGTIAETARPLRRVVLIGPSHREWFRGLAVPVAQAFATPLGILPIDSPAIDALRRLDVILASDVPHALEHSLEVQLPFLQRLAPAAAIVPLLVGDASPAEVERVLEILWDEPDTLIVVSSDLSHYHPYEIARTIDAATAQSILQGREDLSGEQACGCIAIDGLARIRRKRRLRAELLDLCNSGDTAGDRRRVVGYGAFGFYDA